MNAPALATPLPCGEFTFDQLPDSAKEHALDNWRHDGPHDEWYDHTIEDFVRIGEMIGISFKTRPTRLYSGSIVQEPNVFFTLAYCQGDGACFEGDWTPPAAPFAALSSVIEYAPTDNRLHEIVFSIMKVAEELGPNSNENGHVSVNVSHRGAYYHERSCLFESHDTRLATAYDDWNELQQMVWDRLAEKRGFFKVEDTIKEPMINLMKWLYDQLRDEHQYLTSDEVGREELAEKVFDFEGNELT
jgi:hypothetical protein